MSRKEFNKLTNADRIKIILTGAHYLATIKEYSIRRDLYSLFSFFVEVQLSIPASDVESIREVRGVELDKFLSRIRLSL